ncbi:unnamed protein product, partial [marine sediment metagenome]
KAAAYPGLAVRVTTEPAGYAPSVGVTVPLPTV